MDALDRTLQPIRRVLGDVDLAQPLDPTHPLTDGLQGFWLPLPRLVGGSRLYDLSAYSRHGEFVNGSRWGTGRNFSSIVPDGGTDRYIEADYRGLQTGDPLTLVATIYFDQYNGNNFLGQFGPSNKNWIFRDGETVNNNGGELQLWTSSGGWQKIDHDKVPKQEWIHVAVTYKSSEIKYHLNGDVLVSGTPSGGSIAANQSVTTIGRRSPNTPEKAILKGQLSSAAIYSRFLRDSEIEDLHEQWLRGFPGLLNRRDSVGLLGGGGGGVIVSGVSAEMLVDHQIKNSITTKPRIGAVVNLAEEISGSLFTNASRTDSFSVTESVQQYVQTLVSNTVGITLTSSTASILTAVSGLSGDVSLADASFATVKAQNTANVTAALLLNDMLDTTVQVQASALEQASMADVIGQRVQVLQAVQDEVQIIESLAYALAVSKSQSDNLGLFEGVDSAARIQEPISDNAAFEEKVTQTLVAFVSTSETFTLVDDIQSTEGILTVDLPGGRTLTIDPGNRTYTISSDSRVIKPSS